jgi:hypothetical protein
MQYLFGSAHSPISGQTAGSSVVTVNPWFCVFYLVTSQFVALGVHPGAGALTVTSTGRVGLQLEQAHEHKSHNPYCRFYGRVSDGA